MTDHEQTQAEREKRVFEKWYATASIGAKLAYWKQRAKELKA